MSHKGERREEYILTAKSAERAKGNKIVVIPIDFQNAK